MEANNKTEFSHLEWFFLLTWQNKMTVLTCLLYTLAKIHRLFNVSGLCLFDSTAVLCCCEMELNMSLALAWALHLANMERYNSNKVCRDKRQAAVTKYIHSQLRHCTVFSRPGKIFLFNFSCRFLKLNYFFQFYLELFLNVLDLRNLQEQVKKAFCFENCSYLSLFK